MQPPMEYTGQKPVDPLILNVWPQDNGKSSSYTLYEDSGYSEYYKRGIYAQTSISAAQQGGTLKVDIAPVKGGYPGMLASRGYELRTPDDWPPASVTVNGQVLQRMPSDATGSGWYYVGDTLSTVVRIKSHSIAEATHVEIHRHSNLGLQVAPTRLDGFPGAIMRLRSAYNTLNEQWPFSVPPDAVVDALQTGDRLSYYPDTCAEELSHFAQKYAAAQASIQHLLDSLSSLSDDQLESQLMKGRGAETTRERARHYRAALEQALAQLNDGKPK
jgi:alpha-glucosidase